MKNDVRKGTAVLLAAVLLALQAGCSGASTPAADEKAEQTEKAAALPEADYSSRDRDGTWDEDSAVRVVLSDGKITAEGNGIQIEGQTVTIKKAGTYVLSGKLGSGQVIVDAEKTDKIQVVFNNADITCTSSAPFFIKQADKVFVTLADGSANSLTDGEVYSLAGGEDEPDAALFSKEDLTINGSGSLTVTGNYKDGIVSKDDLVIAGGDITVTAAEDAIIGKDSLCVCEGTIQVKAGYDGLKSNEDADAAKGFISLDGGIFTVNAGRDGIQAETSLQINGGEFNITAGGGSEKAEAKTDKDRSRGGPPGEMDGEPPKDPGHRPADGASGGMIRMPDAPSGEAMHMKPEQEPESSPSASQEENKESTKGIKAGGAILITGGTVYVDSADDAVHSNGDAAVSGGTLTLKTGDDGIHADAALTISDGTVAIEESYEGLEGTNITISGGTIGVKASDDGLNAAGENGDVFLLVEGGSLTVDASGDGLDSNGVLTVAGGSVLVNGPVSGGDGALDYEESARITGGIVMAAGSSGMAANFTEGEGQASVMVNFNEVKPAGTRVTLTDEAGNIAVSCTPSKDFQSIVMSAPSIQTGKAYTLYTSGTAEGQEAIVTGGTLSGGEKVLDITLKTPVTSIAEDGAQVTGGGFAGHPGRQGMGGKQK